MKRIFDGILAHGATVKGGRELFLENLRVAKLVKELFETSIGPYGSSKILYEKESGDYRITKDGGSMFKEVSMVHPIAKLMAETGMSVKAEAGDGSLCAVVFCGTLLEKAGELRERGFHPSLIVKGFNEAMKRSIEIVEKLSQTVTMRDRDILMKLAKTYLSTKLDPLASEHLSEISVKALCRINSIDSGEFDMDMFKVEGRAGGSIEDSILVDGVVIHKFGLDDMMPKRVEDARIAIIEKTLGIERPGSSFMIRLRDWRDVPRFFQERRKIMDDMVDSIVEAGVNVVLCTKNIDPEVGSILAKKGILAIRNVQPKDIYNLRLALNARPVEDPKDLKEEYIGECELVEQRVIAAYDRWTFFEGCKNRYVQSILVRGITDELVEDVRNAVKYCLKTLSLSTRSLGVVPGGGATEFLIAKSLREWALRFRGGEQVVIQAFADALEDLAVTPAKNAGMDPVEVKLRLRHELENGLLRGVNVFRREIVDVLDDGLIDASHAKIAYLKSATETASAILRIDHVIQHPKKPIKRKPLTPEPVRMVRRGAEEIIREITEKGGK